MKPEYLIARIYDPEFKVDSVENYKTLIGFLFRTATTILEDDPTIEPEQIWVTYTHRNWE